MNFSTSAVSGAKTIKVLSASVTFGIGLLTMIVLGLCTVAGCQCKMYDRKIEKAKIAAIGVLIDKATAAGADGIMNITFQVFGTTVFVYGDAYTTQE